MRSGTLSKHVHTAISQPSGVPRVKHGTTNKTINPRDVYSRGLDDQLEHVTDQLAWLFIAM